MLYLDNSATTELCKSAKEYMLRAINDEWGNPSSLHMRGITAQMMLEDARKEVAKSVGAKESEIVFTSGGTQSNNIAVFGAVNANARKGKTIITSAVEHPSVANCFTYLENQGYNIIRIPVDKYGIIDIDSFEKSLTDDVILVSIMYVNNELGGIQPIEQAVKLTREKAKNALFHSDCVQAYGKLPVNVKKPGVDMISVSSHKIHGPKGAGALFVKTGVRLVSPVMGGEQEKDIRPGTEPMPAIAGMYGAVKEMNVTANLKKATQVRDYFVSKLNVLDGVIINSSADALPYIINISLPGYPSETLLNFLSDKEIYVSSGSACAKGHKSPVLTAAGLDASLVNSSLRISTSKHTTTEDADEFVAALTQAMGRIRKKS